MANVFLNRDTTTLRARGRARSVRASTAFNPQVGSEAFLFRHLAHQALEKLALDKRSPLSRISLLELLSPYRKRVRRAQGQKRRTSWVRRDFCHSR